MKSLQQHPDRVEFADTIALIDAMYHYTPTAFHNGELFNAAGQNAGSCKIFAFARLHGLDATQTLACFGRHYREDVLQHPDAEGHQNIRNFIRGGWAGIRYEGVALRPR
jgi:hypothetical protein